MTMASGKLQGRTAIVTGASSGLGRAIAIRFAKEGARIVCADITPTARAAIAEEQEKPTHELLTSTYGTHAGTFVKCDVTSEEDIKQLVAKAVEWGGRLDIMCNNAGISTEAGNWEQAQRLHEISTGDWNKTLAVNSTGVFLGCKYSISQFLNQEPHSPNSRGDATRGWIVNTASMLGLVGFNNAACYVASKHAVVGITRTAAIEYAKDRIHVNALCPGFVQTAMIKTDITTTKEAEDQIGGIHPWGQLGTVEDVAKAAVFLASDDASWITGHMMIIDGGYTAQ